MGRDIRFCRGCGRDPDQLDQLDRHTYCLGDGDRSECTTYCIPCFERHCHEKHKEAAISESQVGGLDGDKREMKHGCPVFKRGPYPGSCGCNMCWCWGLRRWTSAKKRIDIPEEEHALPYDEYVELLKEQLKEQMQRTPQKDKERA